MSSRNTQQVSLSTDQRSTRPHASREQSSSQSVQSQPSAVTSESVATQPRTPFTPSTPVSAPNTFRIPASPRTSAMSTGESASKAAKVAIPRLKRSLESQEGSAKLSGRHRVTHACEPCRHRKTKCSGERPTCRHCQDFKIACYYADGKRDRVKK